MKSDLRRYLNGEINVVRDEFILSRERARNAELIYVSHPEREQSIYQFWRSKEKLPRRSTNPKHIGGRQPYVMVMIKELVRLMEAGLEPEYAGYLLYLAPFIEWSTGRLVVGRKKRRMKFQDIVQVYGSRKRTMRVLKRLREHGLIEHTREGYFVSRCLLRKGARVNANQV